MKNKFFLGIDIGTEAVKVLSFQRKNSLKISVLGHSLNYYKYIRREEEIYEAVKKSLEEIGTAFKKRSAFVNLSPDTLKTGFFKETLIRKDNSRIGEKEEKAIYRKAVENAKDSIAGFSVTSFLLAEKKIEGYRVKALSGYGGRKIEVLVIFQFIEKKYLEKIKELLGRLNINITLVASGAPFLSSELLKNWEALFDIGGDSSELFCLKAGVLENIKEFKEGGKFFTKRIAEKLGISENSARELKKKYSSGELTKESYARIKNIFSEAKEEWFEKNKIDFFLSKIFVFGGGAVIPEMKEIKGTELLKPKDLNIIENNSKILENVQYTPLLLTIKYATKNI